MANPERQTGSEVSEMEEKFHFIQMTNLRKQKDTENLKSAKKKNVSS